MLLAELIPGDAGPVAVVAFPWGKPSFEVIAQAEGGIVFVQDGSWIAVTQSPGQEFVERLYEAGAGFVASAAVARACAGWSGVTLERSL